MSLSPISLAVSKNQPGIPESPPIWQERAVEVSGLTFSHNVEPVLEDINLSIRRGDFTAFIGPNGGGKTTLLRLILGLLRPQKGAIRVFGEKPVDMPANVGYVPQFSTMRPDFPATVLDVVLMGSARTSLLGGGWSRSRKARQRANSLLETLGMGGMADSPLHALSGGQRQRVLVARALMGRPDDPAAPFLLLLDEPTASIDPEGKFCFYEFLGNLRGDVTMIVVSHDLFVASPYFSQVFFINRQATLLPDGCSLQGEDLVTLFGRHMHPCPVGDLQHAVGARHEQGCSHGTCSHPEPTANAPDAGAPRP